MSIQKINIGGADVEIEDVSARTNITNLTSEVNTLDSRVTTLENSSGGGIPTSVFYIFDGYLYKDIDLTTKVTADEFTEADATTILSILNMSDMENLGTYRPLFSKSIVDESGNDIIKVLIMQENGVLKAVFTAPYKQQS